MIFEHLLVVVFDIADGKGLRATVSFVLFVRFIQIACFDPPFATG